MASSVSGHHAANESLDDKILRTCEKVVSHMIIIRGGEIEVGHQWPLFQAKAELDRVSDEELKAFTDNDNGLFSQNRPNFYGALAAMIMCAKAYFMNPEEAAQRYPALNLSTVRSGARQEKTLCGVANLAVAAVKEGWSTSVKPTNYDINAAGAKRGTYREPKGIAKEFVDAFGIGGANVSASAPKLRA